MGEVRHEPALRRGCGGVDRGRLPATRPLAASPCAAAEWSRENEDRGGGAGIPGAGNGREGAEVVGSADAGPSTRADLRRRVACASFPRRGGDGGRGMRSEGRAATGKQGK